MQHVAQPVAIITSLLSPSSSPQFIHGATISSFTTISMNPPLVAFSLRTPSRIAHALQTHPLSALSSSANQGSSSSRHPHFLINLLSHHQAHIAAAFARPGLIPLVFHPSQRRLRTSSSAEDQTSQESLDLPAWISRSTPDQIPALEGCMSALACRLEFKLDLSPSPSPTSLGEDDSQQEQEAVVGEGVASSQLFVARVCAVEREEEEEEGSNSNVAPDPLVYCRHKFWTIGEDSNRSNNNR
ncbi:hypothetical protein CF327_g2563 [Tilletia walkeri]|nr:hypothetical protein CF327_g2563 [Tilletia walkeri]